MNKIFTQAGLERMLFDLQFGPRLERLNLGRNYRFTLRGGGNPFAAAMAAEPGETIDALMWVDETTFVGATVTAHSVSREVHLPKPNVEESDPLLSGSLAASGKTRKKKQSRDVDATSFEVTVDGYNVRGATVEDGESCAGSALESGRHVFPDSEHNDCVASASAQASVRARPDGQALVKGDPQTNSVTSHPTSAANSSDDEKTFPCCSDEEKALIQEIIKSKGLSGFDRLIDAYDNVITAFVRTRFSGLGPVGVEDIVQMVFIAVFGSIHTFDGGSRLETWICGMACNIVSDRIRFATRDKRDCRRNVSLQAIGKPNGCDEGNGDFDLECQTERPLQCIVREENKRELLAAMQELTSQERDLLSLRYSEDLAWEKVAARMVIRPENARTKHRRALQKLRDILSERSVDINL